MAQKKKGGTQGRKKGAPRALKNADVTGMTKGKQEKVAREMARGPQSESARRFIDELERQASTTSPSKK